MRPARCLLPVNGDLVVTARNTFPFGRSPSYHVVLSDDSDVNLSLKPNLRREVARPRMGRRSLGHCDLKREFSPKERQRGLSRRLTEKEKDANGLEGRGPEGRRLSIQQRNSAVLQLRERKHELEAKREAKNVSDTEKKYDAQFRGHGAEADKDSSRACRKLTAERRVSEGESVRSTQGSSDSCGLHAHACPQLPPRGAWNGQAYTVAVACGQPYLPPGTNPSAGSAYCESYFGHACMHTHAPTPLISTHTLPCGVMPSLQSPLFLAVDAPQNTREYSRSSGGMEPSQRTCEQTLHPCKISKNVSVATSSSSEPLSSMKSSPRHTVAVNADDTNVGVLGVNTLTLDEEVSTQVLIAQSREPRSEEKSPYSGCGDFEKTDPKPVAAAPSDAPAVISAETLLNDKAAPMVAPPSVPGTQNSENLPQNNTTLSPKTECDEGTIRSPGVPRTDLCASSQSQKDQFVTGSEHSNAKNLSSGTQCEMELHDETTEFLTEVDCRLEGLLRCLHSAETLREYFALKHPSNALLQNDISDTDRLRDSDADGEKTKKGSFSPSPFGSLAHTLLGISHILGRPALHKNIDPDLLLPSVQQGVADVPEVGLYSMLLRARNSDHAGAPFAPSRYNYPGNQDARSLCTSLTRNEATPMGIGDDGADSAYVHTMADSPLTHASPASAPSESVRMAQKLHIASVEGSTHKGAEKQLFQDTAEQRALLVQSASRLVMPALSPVPVTREQRWQSRYGELAADQGTHKQVCCFPDMICVQRGINIRGLTCLLRVM